MSRMVLLLWLLFCTCGWALQPVILPSEGLLLELGGTIHPRRFAGIKGEGYGHHAIVWQKGAVAQRALITADLSDREVADRLAQQGLQGGNNLDPDAWEKRFDPSNPAADTKVEGPPIAVFVSWEGSVWYRLEDLLGMDTDYRFGDHRQFIPVWKSGCIVCNVSCPGGKISNHLLNIRDQVQGRLQLSIPLAELPPDGTPVKIRLYPRKSLLPGEPQGGPSSMTGLLTNGKEILNASGEKVHLRGINLGSWLMMETWIPRFGATWEEHLRNLAEEQGIAASLKEALAAAGKFDDDNVTFEDHFNRILTHLSELVSDEDFVHFRSQLEKEPLITDATKLNAVLVQRFGQDGARQVWEVFHQDWIQEQDFRNIHEMGFNFVRIPFWYVWVDGKEPWGQIGFKYLDQAFDWATRYSLLILLDFHGAPGGQSPWEHTGELSRGELFRCEDCIAETARIWKGLAQRYHQHPALLGYNLLNEPFSATNREEWTAVHDRLYRAIREVDPHHLIVMEDGYKLENPQNWLTGFFPRPEDHGWRNVVYSFHFYQTGEMEKHHQRAALIQEIGLREQQRCNTPIYIGEFNTIDDKPEALEALKLYLNLFEELGWHWSPWTYKFTGNHSEPTLWGLYQYQDKWQEINLYRDSLEEILEKVRRLNSDHFQLHPGLHKVLQGTP